MIMKFEDIVAWQKARNLNRRIIKLERQGRLNNVKYIIYPLKTSSNSIKSNIAEGFGRSSNKEFCHFLFITNGSVNEVKSHLTTVLDEGVITEEELNELYDDADEISKKILGFVKYLRSKQ